VTEFGKGESQEAPFTMLDETVHMKYNDACVSYKSSETKIASLITMAKKHDKILVKGDCT